MVRPVEAATRIRPRKASNLRRPIPRMIRISSTLRKGGFLARNSRIRRASTGPTPGSDSSSLRPAELMSSRSPSSIGFEGDGCGSCRAGAADSCLAWGACHRQPSETINQDRPSPRPHSHPNRIATLLVPVLQIGKKPTDITQPLPTHVEHKKSIPQDTEPCQTKPNGMGGEHLFSRAPPHTTGRLIQGETGVLQTVVSGGFREQASAL